MTAADFIRKWRRVRLTERSAAQQHFLDLCALLGHPTPTACAPASPTMTPRRHVLRANWAI